MTKSFKTLNIEESRHSQLRLEAAKNKIPIYKLVDRLLEIGIKFNLYDCDLSKLEQLKNNPK